MNVLKAEIKIVYNIIKRFWAHKNIHDYANNKNLKKVVAKINKIINKNNEKYEYAKRLRDTLFSLQDGHLRLIVPQNEGGCYYKSGIYFKEFKEGIGIINVDPAMYGDELKKSLIGSIIIKINDNLVNDYINNFTLKPGSTKDHIKANAISALSYQELLPSEDPYPQTIVLTNAVGKKRRINLKWYKINKLTTYKCLSMEDISKNTGLLRVKSFYKIDELGCLSTISFLKEVKQILPLFQDKNTIIIDLRENCGGIDDQAQILASIFINTNKEWLFYKHNDSWMKYKQDDLLIDYLIADKWLNESVTIHKIYILISSKTYSTAEIFAHFFKNHFKAIFIGQPTGGGAGNPITFRLPYSGLQIQVPVTQFYTNRLSNKTIETNPIIPDIEVIPSIDDFIKGEDTSLREIISM